MRLAEFLYVMIISFADFETEEIFNGNQSKRLPTDIQRRAALKLAAINIAPDINDLRVPPSNHLEKLSGNRAGQYSIRINDKYRICFIWTDENNAENVEILDYH